MSGVWGESGLGLDSTPGRNRGSMGTSGGLRERSCLTQYCGVPDANQVTAGALAAPSARERVPYGVCLCVGLGGVFSGVTGPLLSTFVPPVVRDAIGDQRTVIGAVMAIDNVLLLLLVPWAGAASDRSSAAGRGRLPIVIGGLVLAAI